jgi:hypothetical protein
MDIQFTDICGIKESLVFVRNVGEYIYKCKTYNNNLILTYTSKVTFNSVTESE